MEYVILIIVIAVLALGTGGWLLFVRPRRGRSLGAPPAQAPVPPAQATTTPAGSGEAESAAAPETPAAAVGVLEVERPPPSAGRLVRLRARLARSQSSVCSALPTRSARQPPTSCRRGGSGSVPRRFGPTGRAPTRPASRSRRSARASRPGSTS